MFRHRYIPLLFILVLAACGKDDPQPPPPSAPGPVTEEPVPFEPIVNGAQGVQMTIDGQVVSYIQGGGILPYYHADGVENTPPQPSYRFYSAGMYSGELNAYELSLGTLTYTDQFVDPALFQEFFQEGSREYGSTTTPGVARVAMEYVEPDGTVWSTQQGSAVQTNSNFMITTVETDYDDLGVYARIIAEFNCTLYSAGGAAREVSDGILMLEFREY